MATGWHLPNTDAARVESKLLTSLEVKQVDQEGRTIEGYAATFGNLDLNGDVIDKKAFDKTLKDKKPSDIAVFVGHNSSMLPVGIPVEMRTDDKGLFTKTKIFKTQQGDDLLQTAKELQSAGQPLGMSIGFQTRDSKWQTKDGKTYRLLTDADLMEYSYAAKQVIASPPALVTAIKTQQKGARMAEHEHFAPGEQTVWSTTYIQGLPDGAFAYIEDGGEQVEGKTVPHSLRHFPHHNEDGTIDPDVLQRELDRARESPFREFGYKHLRDHAIAEGLIGDGPKTAADAISEMAATLSDLSLECADVSRALVQGTKLGFDGAKIGVRLKGTMRGKLKNIKAALEELIAWAENAESGGKADDDEDEEKDGKKSARRGTARRALERARFSSLIAWDGKASNGEINLDDLHSAIEHLEEALGGIENDGDGDEEKARKAGKDNGKWDPDGDGDDDSTPEGDTDHDHWSASGRQLKPVPGKPLNGKSWSPEDEEEKDSKAAGKAAIVGGGKDIIDHLNQAHADMMSHHDAIHGEHSMGKSEKSEGKAEWSTSKVNDLPDSAFAVVYTNDAGQKERKLPHHDSDGSVDLPHLRNGLARHGHMTGVPDSVAEKGLAHLQNHAKEAGIGDYGDKVVKTRRNGSRSNGHPTDAFAALKEMELTLAKYSQSDT